MTRVRRWKRRRPRRAGGDRRFRRVLAVASRTRRPPRAAGADAAKPSAGSSATGGATAGRLARSRRAPAVVGFRRPPRLDLRGAAGSTPSPARPRAARRLHGGRRAARGPRARSGDLPAAARSRSPVPHGTRLASAPTDYSTAPRPPAPSTPGPAANTRRARTPSSPGATAARPPSFRSPSATASISDIPTAPTGRPPHRAAPGRNHQRPTGAPLRTLGGRDVRGHPSVRPRGVRAHRPRPGSSMVRRGPVNQFRADRPTRSPTAEQHAADGQRRVVHRRPAEPSLTGTPAGTIGRMK